jgi:hypothetical protein
VSFRKTELILYKAWVYYLLSELSSCCFQDWSQWRYYKDGFRCLLY